MKKTFKVIVELNMNASLATKKKLLKKYKARFTYC